MRTRAPWLALAALLLAAGCVTTTTLQPLPSTPLAQAGVAVAEADGVRLLAAGDAWRGNPSDLGRIVTPVKVHLDNQSGRPLRIDPGSFTLQGGSRFSYAALSPFEMSEEGNAAVGGSGYEGGNVAMSIGVGVGVSPYWAWGPGAAGWGYPWGPGWYGPGFGPGWYGSYYGPGWYDPFWGPYASWYAWPPPEPLPTRDMLRNALPEGTLEPGGTLTGFLYFQNVSGREGTVTLQAQLVDARTGEPVTTLSIPFGVSS
ncbi:hypothetical protein BO221_37965 [Archangium sp. Cb G35]|uniref:hypothetical protein n=1 Tax=Archangium sp. Cb G35 TaxID=1920190 RepID=UPI000936B513|nr:hypothetical protein [Archangium sp. Cb G35]OJT19272.1 hypothetical protein BO221_37965 [Archangium sp. Cb G35]